MNRFGPGMYAGAGRVLLLVFLGFALRPIAAQAQYPSDIGDDERAFLKIVRSGRLPAVRKALESGVLPTPWALYTATEVNNTDVLDLLIRSGGDVNGRVQTEEFGGIDATPLCAAVLRGRSDMVKLLLEAGADTDIQCTMLGLTQTPLEAAAMFGRDEVVGQLSEASAKIVPQAGGSAAAQAALAMAMDRGDIDAIRSALHLGADVNALVANQYTPLSLAAGNPKWGVEMMKEAVALFLDHGADVNARNADGSTPFMLASRRGNTEVMSLLVDAGADVDARDDAGQHAISYADGYDPASQFIESRSQALSSRKSATQAAYGGSYPPGALGAPCQKSGGPPSFGIPDQQQGLLLETNTVVSGPRGVRASVTAPECSPMDLTTPGEYSGSVISCSTSWKVVSEYELRETSGATRTLAYLDREQECLEQPIQFSVDPTLKEPGEPDRCAGLQLAIAAPVAREEFSFDGSDPAQVEIPLRATVQPAACDAEVRWSAPYIENVMQRFFDLNGAPSDGTGTETRLVLENLPSSNDAFGPITIRVTAGEKEDSVEVLLFFDPLATNHPEEHPIMPELGYDGVPEKDVPNWFYYWTQTTAIEDSAREITRYKPSIAAKNNPTDRVAGRYIAGDELIALTDLGFSSGCRGRVNRATLVPTGVLARGIDCFAELIRHEYQHRREDVQWWRTGAGGVPILGGLVQLYRSNTADDDRDNVPAEIEAALADGCSDQSRHSCRHLPFPDVTDAEINAYYVGWTWPIGNANDQDWSRCGKQWTRPGC